MAKTKISEWSSTPGSNTDIDGINIAEGCAPSGINDAIRELMSQVKDLYSGTTGDAVAIAGGGTGATTASAARTALGVAIGTDVQAYDAELATLAGMSSSRATYLASTEGFGFRNRLINGDMRIDQRNAGAAITSAGYCVDRWNTDRPAGAVYTQQQVADAPAGFVNSLRITNTTPATPTSGQYTFSRQIIEGLNISDLGWGTASAQAVTVSFWVKASITGTYSLFAINSAEDRSYVGTFAVSAANTWEFKTVTIPGDTSGTWLTNNSNGIRFGFDLGSGSNFQGTGNAWNSGWKQRTSGTVNFCQTSGATFQFTGVQLEAGSVASPFERRDYGRELMMCQRYYQRFGYDSITARIGTGAWASSTNAYISMPLLVQMRSTPTFTSPNRGRVVLEGVNWYNCTVAALTGEGSPTFVTVSLNVTSSSAVAGQVAAWGGGNALAVDAQFSAEL